MYCFVFLTNLTLKREYWSFIFITTNYNNNVIKVTFDSFFLNLKAFLYFKTNKWQMYNINKEHITISNLSFQKK